MMNNSLSCIVKRIAPGNKMELTKFQAREVNGQNVISTGAKGATDG
jgi:hypothetical protein